jgi:LPS sulfotransferase NodH
MGDPQEWYNEKQPRYHDCDKYGIPFVQRLADATATGNGVFGIKLMLGCLGRFGIAAQWPAIRERFSPQVVWLRRRDKLRQAISRYRASQSGRWLRPTTAAPPPPPEFDAAEIRRNYDRLVAWEADWEREFRKLAICPRQVWYEEILADPQSVVDAICGLVGVSAPLVDPSGCPLAVQRDELTEIWVRRLTA